MILLTGKAKEDFEKWYYADDTTVENYTDYTTIYAIPVIIQWLDTVGIIIDYQYDAWTQSFNCYLTNDDIHIPKIDFEYWATDAFESRQQATKAAIQEANLIYNEKNT